jgi:hypothetical protein
MAKKKAKKKSGKPTKQVPHAPITIVVPDQLMADDKAILQAIAKLLMASGADVEIGDVTLVSSKKLTVSAQAELKKHETAAASTCPL